MDDDPDIAAWEAPAFDDAQWAYLLRQDDLTAQLVRHTAQLELLHTYYQEISAGLRRQPSGELRLLRATTLARIRSVTGSAAAVLQQMEEQGMPRARHRQRRAPPGSTPETN